MRHFKWRFVVFCLYCGVPYAQHFSAKTPEPKLTFRTNHDVIVVVNSKRYLIKGDKRRYIIRAPTTPFTVLIQRLNGKWLKKWPAIRFPSQVVGVYFEGANAASWKATFLKKKESNNEAVVITKAPKARKNRTNAPQMLSLKLATSSATAPMPVVLKPNNLVEEAFLDIQNGAYQQGFERLKHVPIALINNEKVLVFLGDCYAKRELGFATDTEKALAYYQEALKIEERAETYWAMARLCLQHPPKETPVVEYLQKANQKGHLEAALELGRIYFSGAYRVLKDEGKGLELIEKAAEGGVTAAQYQLGKIYSKGTEQIPKDMKKAKFWYAKVAHQ